FDPDDWPRIPHPADIAAKLVRAIFNAPESDEAQKNRLILKRLISLGLTKSGRHGRGRPPAAVPRETLRFLCRLSYCQVLQVREVFRLLENRKVNRRDQNSRLNGFFPWLRELFGEPHTVASDEPSKTAVLLVSRLTGVSPSL